MREDIKVAIGIQARTTSQRLPGKITQLIGNKFVIDHVIEACKNCSEYINRYSFTNHIVANVFVLIPKGDPVKDLLGQMSDQVIEGDENDVLSRYVTMAEQADAAYIVRVTADCPLIPPFLIFKCVNTAIKNGFDYFSNVGDANPESIRTAIDGHDVEVFSKKALDWADKNATSPRQREHVTTVLRDDYAPAFLRRGVLIGHNDHSNIKLSLDTEEDLKRIQEEFEKVQKKISIAKKKYGKNAVHRF